MELHLKKNSAALRDKGFSYRRDDTPPLFYCTSEENVESQNPKLHTNSHRISPKQNEKSLIVQISISHRQLK